MASLFDQNNDLDLTKNYLEELVGEGKKFKTPEELARGKYEADLTIKAREQELANAREDYLKLQQAAASRQNDELLARLEARLEALSSNTAPQPVAPERIQPDPVDESKLFSLIDKREAQKKADANFREVQNKLKEEFGNSYQTALQERLDFYGLSAEDMDTLARKSPKAFYNTLGINQQQSSIVSSPRSSFNTAGFQNKEPKRTWSYWEDLRKKDPVKYNSQASRNQRHDDAITLGAEFQDGDFNG